MTTGAPRYEPVLKIASGGMATVFLGARRGAAGFVHLVALKRPHPHLTEDPGFRRALLTEAQVASELRHANVVSVRDVVEGDPLELVMDYVEGGSLGSLIARWARGGPTLAPAVAVRIALDVLEGLDALHELTDARGAKLDLVHRDVSPQNVLVGRDGLARITDFGLARATRAAEQSTSQGTIKGKLGYVAPEYVNGARVDRRADIYAAGVVLWEALTAKRLFRGESDAETLDQVLRAPVPPPSSVHSAAPATLDAVILKALARAPDERFETARALIGALEGAAAPRGLIAPRGEVTKIVEEAFGAELAERRTVVDRHLRKADPSSGDPIAFDRNGREPSGTPADDGAADATPSATRRLAPRGADREPQDVSPASTRARRSPKPAWSARRLLTAAGAAGLAAGAIASAVWIATAADRAGSSTSGGTTPQTAPRTSAETAPRTSPQTSPRTGSETSPRTAAENTTAAQTFPPNATRPDPTAETPAAPVAPTPALADPREAASASATTAAPARSRRTAGGKTDRRDKRTAARRAGAPEPPPNPYLR